MVTLTSNSAPYAVLLGALTPATSYLIRDEELVRTFSIQGVVRTLIVTAQLQRSEVVDTEDWFSIQLKDAGSQGVIAEKQIDVATVRTSWSNCTTILTLAGRRDALSLSFNHVGDQNDQNTQLRIDDVSVTCL